MRILFVCTGNTCRSSMAEGLFKDTLKKLGKDKEIFVESAGVYAMPNEPASENAILAMQKQSIDLNNHRSRQVTVEMLERSDIILTMTMAHKQILLQHIPEIEDKIFSLKEFVGLDGDISDPYGGNLDIYEESLRDIKEALDKLSEQLNIKN